MVSSTKHTTNLPLNNFEYSNTPFVQIDWWNPHKNSGIRLPLEDDTEILLFKRGAVRSAATHAFVPERSHALVLRYFRQHARGDHVEPSNQAKTDQPQLSAQSEACMTRSRSPHADRDWCIPATCASVRKLGCCHGNGEAPRRNLS